MTIVSALSRFEATMAGAWPAAFAALRPAASDSDFRRLRDAVAPYQLPTQVETLYRWRDGGDEGVFGGWRMRPVGELIEWYRFTVEELQAARTWLPVFDDRIVNIVTLDVPGLAPSNESVWWGHTHDLPVYRLFESIEALLDVVSDACEAGVVTEDSGRLGIAGEDYVTSVEERPWVRFRLGRSPGSYSWPDTPPGTELPKFLDAEWPAAWRAGITGAMDATAPDH